MHELEETLALLEKSEPAQLLEEERLKRTLPNYDKNRTRSVYRYL